MQAISVIDNYLQIDSQQPNNSVSVKELAKQFGQADQEQQKKIFRRHYFTLQDDKKFEFKCHICENKGATSRFLQLQAELEQEIENNIIGPLKDQIGKEKRILEQLIDRLVHQQAYQPTEKSIE